MEIIERNNLFQKSLAITVILLFVGTSIVTSNGHTAATSNPLDNPLSDPNEPPIADAGGPYYANIEEEITFNGSRSYDPDGNITSYEWNFGDGITGSGQIVNHTYYNPGDYTVILTVIDNDGAIDNDTTTAYINSPPCEPNIDGPASGKPGIDYEFSFSSCDSEGDDLYYYIDWGDGSNSSWIGPNASGQEITLNHTWDEKGNYTIRAKAKDILGAESDWTTMDVTMPYSYEPQFPFIQWLFERFPQAFPLLRYLLNF